MVVHGRRFLSHACDACSVIVALCGLHIGSVEHWGGHALRAR